MKFFRDCGCDRARAGRRRPPALRAALLQPLLLLLLLLLVPRAAAAPLPNADSSGEAELEEAAARRAALPDSLRLARLLHARAAQLQDEVGTAGSHTLTRPRLPPDKVRPNLSLSLPRCARSLPSARTAWKCSSRTTSTSPR